MTARHTLPPGRVLLVEDDADLREVLAEVLLDEGWSVVVAASGHDVLRVDRTRLAAAIVDMHLPGPAGVEVARLVQEECPGARIVLMSGRDDLKVPPGMARLVKPFEISSLLALLRPVRS